MKRHKNLLQLVLDRIKEHSANEETKELIADISVWLFTF